MNTLLDHHFLHKRTSFFAWSFHLRFGIEIVFPTIWSLFRMNGFVLGFLEWPFKIHRFDVLSFCQVLLSSPNFIIFVLELKLCSALSDLCSRWMDLYLVFLNNHPKFTALMFSRFLKFLSCHTEAPKLACIKWELGVVRARTHERTQHQQIRTH